MREDDKTPLRLAKIRIEYETVDGTSKCISSAVIPDVVAQDFLIKLTNWESDWHTSFAEARAYFAVYEKYIQEKQNKNQ